MSEAPGSTTCDSTLHFQWKTSGRRSRKSGCPNIFSGMNLQQLHRLFRGAGDRDAEHRARLVWRGTEEDAEKDMEREMEEVREVEEKRDDTGLAQALVGLRVRARNKAGFRVDAPMEHKRLKASGYLRIVEPLSSCTVDREADTDQSPGEFATADDDDDDRIQNPFKPCSWRLDVARQTERYLHRILH